MAISHIFVSHATEDAKIATNLVQHLRNAGHETMVDTRDLALGDNPIAFMNRGIADAAAVIILFSKHTPAAPWQKLEIDAAVWSQVARDGGRCIVYPFGRHANTASAWTQSLWRANTRRPSIPHEVSGNHLQRTNEWSDVVVVGCRSFQTQFAESFSPSKS